VSLAGRDLVRIDDLSLEEINDLMALARRLEPVARGDAVTRVLEGAILASLFFEASTRTRLSFGAAFARLGGDVRETVGFTFSSMAKGESIADTARVVSGYADIMVVRHPEAGKKERN
jgi:aspartate carbamoyltransferase catalytic subunit